MNQVSLNDEPRILLFACEENGNDVYIDYTEDIRRLIQWEIKAALLARSPTSPLPPDRFDDDVAPPGLRYP